MTLNPKEVLKQTFGYEEFRQGQNQIISSIVNKKNVLAIMPTGAGKSLCYQIPAIICENKTIVISPLVIIEIILDIRTTVQIIDKKSRKINF